MYSRKIPPEIEKLKKSHISVNWAIDRKTNIDIYRLELNSNKETLTFPVSVFGA